MPSPIEVNSTSPAYASIAPKLTEDDKERSLTMLSIPYVILTLFLLAMAFISFFHYHMNNKAKYQNKKRVCPGRSVSEEAYPNKYRVTMSRNAKISLTEFNILDFIHKYYLYDDGHDMKEHLVSSTTKTRYNTIGQSDEQDHNSDYVFPINNKSNKLRTNNIIASSKHRQLPTPPGEKDNYDAAMSLLQAGADIYVNEAYAYDSNCDSDKSLITEAHSSTKSSKTPYFYNHSYESQESSPVETNIDSDNIHPPNYLRSKLHISNPHKGSKLKNKQLQKMSKTTSINSVSEHIPEQLYPEPDILMHSVYAKSHSPHRKTNWMNRPHTLDLQTKPLTKKERFQMKNRDKSETQ